LGTGETVVSPDGRLLLGPASPPIKMHFSLWPLEQDHSRVSSGTTRR